MKRIGKLLSVLLALCLLLGAAPNTRAAATSGKCGTNLTWEYSNGTLTISGTGKMDDYNIIFDVPWYLFNRSATSVVVENGCTHIGKRAFYTFSNLARVTLPESGLNSIGYGAFESCSRLESITLSDGLTTIGDFAFNHCKKLKSVTLPNGMKSIGEWAFSSCYSLESVNIPEGVTSLKRSVFSECVKLSEVTLPASLELENFNTGSFYGCASLAAFKVAPGSKSFCTQDGVLFSADKKLLVAYPCGKTTSDGAPAESYVIPSGVQKIRTRAFYGAGKLESVFIPDSVTGLGERAFCASGLTSVTIPDRVTTIGDGMFQDCAALRSFTLPANITKISDAMFCNCTALESVVLPATVTSIGDNAFMRCDALRYIILQDGVESIGAYAFDSCPALEWITIPSSVTGIGKEAFNRCPALRNAYYAGSTPEWGEISLAAGNDALRNAEMHPHTGFGTCGADLKWLLTNEGTLYIFGEGAMDESNPWRAEHKEDITAVDIASGVTGISKGAFSGCSNFKYIILPASVKAVGASATNGCNGLKHVYYSGSERDWMALNNGLPAMNQPLKDATVHCNTTGPWTAINAAVWGQMIDYCTVQNVPAGAVLIAARYDEGRMTGVWTYRFDSGKDYWRMDTILREGEGNMFRLMLVDGTTFAPLCASWDNTYELSEPEEEPEPDDL